MARRGARVAVVALILGAWGCVCFAVGLAWGWEWGAFAAVGTGEFAITMADKLGVKED